MTRADLLVKGRIFAGGRVAPGAFTVKDGRVHEMREGDAREVLDFGDKLVTPGAVDPHVHFRDPGHPQKEDFASGTRAAAMGGVTTVLDMPNTVPPVFSPEALDAKLAIARAKACVDFGLFAGLDERGEALEIVGRASAVKVYLGATTGHLLVRDYGLVRLLLQEAAKTNRTVVFHAESQACLERHAHFADATFPSHAASRPPVCEAEAIAAIAEAAKGTGARVHIAHLSTKAGLDAIQGTGFTAEVCPHHLLLPETKLREGGRFKMNPPLRAQEDLAALWAGLRDGRILCLASDHAPHTKDEKSADNMPACPSGVPGVETLLAVLLPRALAGDISLERLLSASVAAAERFRLPRKGALAPGMDADFAVYDLGAARPVRGAELASRCGWSPFEGMPAIFPADVYLRGIPVVRGGKFLGEPGEGQFLAPP